MRFTHKSHHFLRSLRKPWKLGMRVQQLVLSCARSRKTTEIERKHIMRKHRKKTYVWQHGTCCQLVYSVFFSVLPAIQSFLAQLLGKAVALTIIIGDFILTWASVNKIIEKHVSYICTRPYRSMSGITSWLLMTEENKQVSGWNKFWQLC